MTSQNSEYAREEAKRRARNIRQATSNKEEASSTTNYDTTNHAHNNQQARGNINTHSSSPPFILDLGRSWHCFRPALGTRQVSIPLFLSVKRQILLSLFDGAGRSGRSKICIINSEKCSIASIFTTRAREFGIPLSLLVRNAVISHFPFIHLIFNPLTNPHSQYRNNKLPTFHPSTKNYEPSTP